MGFRRMLNLERQDQALASWDGLLLFDSCFRVVQPSGLRLAVGQL